MAKKLFESEWIEIICGPMFSGKSTELLRKLNRLHWANIDFITFKPAIDTRGGNDTISSRNGDKLTTHAIKSPYEIIEILSKQENRDIKVVAIDEVQFLDESIVDVVKVLAKKGYHIILACLDKDWRGNPFGPVANLLAIADEINKLTAFCSVCKKECSFTDRITKENKDTILIGDFDSYEARCRKHHNVNKQKNSDAEELFNQLFKTKLEN